MSSEIVVLGSLNIDLVVKAERVPEAGETLAGQDFQTIPGGKGANQAVAIAKAGGQAVMVGRVGSDDYGKQLKTNLAAYGVETSRVIVDSSTTTGMALIIVEKSGENRILLVSGANDSVSKEDVDAVKLLICHAKALVLQMEIPWDTTKYALELAHKHHIPVVLNLAPAYPVPADVLRKVSFLIVNESEIQILSGIEVNNISTAKQAASKLVDQGVNVVILTLGKLGALLATKSDMAYFPPFAVGVVDTTAAGDAFVGSFVASYFDNGDLLESIKFANAAGALAVTKFGAQVSLPSRDDVEGFLASQSV